MEQKNLIDKKEEIPFNTAINAASMQEISIFAEALAQHFSSYDFKWT